VIAMITGRIREGLEPNWAKGDPSVAHRSSWPVHKGTGATDSAATYFEIDPAHHIGRHVHDCGETVLLLSGRGRAVVADDERPIAPGDIVHAPAGGTHDVFNDGDDTLELLGFFAAPEVTTVFEQVQMPDDSKELGTPD
jgi:quercetin dioxygenase-like cupin family protein